MTLLKSPKRLIHLVIGNGQFDFLDLDTQIVFDFNRRLDLENSRVRKRATFDEVIGFNLWSGNNLQPPLFNNLAQRIFYQLGLHLILKFVPVHTLQDTPRCLTSTKSLYPYSPPQFFIRAGKPTRYCFRGQFNADLTLHWTYFIDIYFHNSIIESESRCRDNRPTFNPSSNLIDYLRFWCERGDSNPHGCPLDPKSSASASSATLALGKIQRYLTSTGRKTRVENRAC